MYRSSPMRALWRHSTVCLLFIAALLATGIAYAQQRWLTLPPTPALPEQYAVSGVFTPEGARHWYEVYGDKAKPAVLLLHAGGGNSNYWGHLIRDLMHDYYVIVVDSRGQGRSTHTATHISYEQMAQDAIALLDYLKVKNASIVGWSDGANTGLYLALRYPERISALVAFGGNATPAGYQASTNPELMAAYFARTRNEYFNLSFERPRDKPKSYAATTRSLSVMWRTQPTFTRQDLEAIKVRTAIFHAEHDEIIRRIHSVEIAKQMPSAQFVLLRGVSHFAPLQDPKGFNEAVRAFLAAR